MTDPKDATHGPRSPAALKELVASIEHLPMFTGMAAQLVRSAERDDVTSGELARLIATDPALSAHLLRMVNSPFYGLARRIGVVSEALAVLGLDLVRRIVTTEVLRRPFFAYLHDTHAARTFWNHELLCAALARHLHNRRGGNGEAAYMAGLLHDIGKLVLMVEYPQATQELLAVDDPGNTSRAEQERARFGFDHALIGAALLEFWEMPQPLVTAVGQHADESEPDEPLAASVWNANLLAHQLVDDGHAADDAAGDESEQPWMTAVGLDAKTRRKILDEVAALAGDD